MDEVRLAAEERVALGKKVKALRRSGVTPIHVYGSGGPSLSLQSDTYDLVHALGVVGQTSPMTVQVGGDEHFVMVQHVQRHPVSERLLHVDLLRVSRTQRIHASVPLHFEGEASGARAAGATLSEDLHELEVEALPTDIPHSITVDLSALSEPDSVVHAGDLALPAGVTMVTDPGAYVARIIVHAAVAEEEEEAAEEAAPEADAGTEETSTPEAEASSE
ncbi:MAG: 50S ribosomal protein L25 [Chloroflexota bacterium]|nr:50S ribosomal protein L25 [Chloroflexota bacterium]MDE2886403.1 50S ribosomal protein L25 [Chloroflexota bacterium]